MSAIVAVHSKSKIAKKLITARIIDSAKDTNHTKAVVMIAIYSVDSIWGSPGNGIPPSEKYSSPSALLTAIENSIKPKTKLNPKKIASTKVINHWKITIKVWKLPHQDGSQVIQKIKIE